MRRDEAIIELQEQVRGQRGAWISKKINRQSHHYRELDVSPTGIAYSSSYEDYDNKDRGVKGIRHPKDDLRDFRVETLEFNGTSIQKTT